MPRPARWGVAVRRRRRRCVLTLGFQTCRSLSRLRATVGQHHQTGQPGQRRPKHHLLTKARLLTAGKLCGESKAAVDFGDQVSHLCRSLTRRSTTLTVKHSWHLSHVSVNSGICRAVLALDAATRDRSCKGRASASTDPEAPAAAAPIGSGGSPRTPISPTTRSRPPAAASGRAMAARRAARPHVGPACASRSSDRRESRTG